MRLQGPLITLDSVDSTQNAVSALLRQDKPVGGVMAREQTAGRGRFGRPWSSPPDQCLAVSLVFPTHPRPYVLGMGIAVACAKAFGVQVQWPNDVVARGLKLGGILTELHPAPAGRQIPVVGIGLNLTDAAFPPELSETATSLKAATGRLWGPKEALDELLKEFDLFSPLNSWQDLAKRWGQVDATPGKRYRLHDGREAAALRVGEDGELICLGDGHEQRILAADAILGPASSK